VLSARHKPVIVVSDLVRMECLVAPLKHRNTQLRELLSGFFDLVEVVGLPAVVFDLAADLRAMCSLKTPDALHAACAIHYGCDELWTNDNDLSALGGRLRTRVVQ
jgi:predicted nucleic acid-binding protein